MGWWRRAFEPPKGWEEVAARRLVHFAALDADERARLGADIGRLLGEKRWEASRGFDLTEEIRLTIAAQAALLILGLDIDGYHDVRSIIVHPTTRVLTGPRPGPAHGVVTDAPFPVIGQAHDRRGPVIIAWDAVARDTRHPERGHNVVFHEFAHRLDMLDGITDGTPPLGSEEANRRWAEVCTPAYERVVAGQSVLRPYAATNPAEFFAVATEAFFCAPGPLAQGRPALYRALCGFYRQDPAGAGGEPGTDLP